MKTLIQHGNTQACTCTFSEYSPFLSDEEFYEKPVAVLMEITSNRRNICFARYVTVTIFLKVDHFGNLLLTKGLNYYGTEK